MISHKSYRAVNIPDDRSPTSYCIYRKSAGLYKIDLKESCCGKLAQVLQLAPTVKSQQLHYCVHITCKTTAISKIIVMTSNELTVFEPLKVQFVPNKDVPSIVNSFPIKKNRGRHSKNPLKTEDIVQIEENMEKVTITTQENKTVIKNDKNSPKRRGRPPKNLLQSGENVTVKTEVEDITVKTEENIENVTITTEETVPKNDNTPPKRRGRPPKTPLKLEENVTVKIEETLGKRESIRPMRYIEADVNRPVSKIVNISPKRRGRPPKTLKNPEEIPLKTKENVTVTAVKEEVTVNDTVEENVTVTAVKEDVTVNETEENVKLNAVKKDVTVHTAEENVTLHTAEKNVTVHTVEENVTLPKSEKNVTTNTLEENITMKMENIPVEEEQKISKIVNTSPKKRGRPPKDSLKTEENAVTVNANYTIDPELQPVTDNIPANVPQSVIDTIEDVVKESSQTLPIQPTIDDINDPYLQPVTDNIPANVPQSVIDTIEDIVDMYRISKNDNDVVNEEVYNLN